MDAPLAPSSPISRSAGRVADDLLNCSPEQSDAAFLILTKLSSFWYNHRALDVLLVTRLDRLARSTRDLLIDAEQPGRVGVESLRQFDGGKDFLS
jgi:hypothetical protein